MDPNKSLTAGRLALALALLTALALLASPLLAADPLEKIQTGYTKAFHTGECTWSDTGSNRYFVLEPGFQVTLEGTEEDDEGDEVDIQQIITVMDETEMVDGVLTRVVEERESEDGELAEVSRNFHAICMETGDVLYFGEDVDDYEDGEIVGHGGAWRAGVDGARPGIVMPGRILIGARYFQEVAPDVALDVARVIAMGVPVETPWKDFHATVAFWEGNLLDPEDEGAIKYFASGIGVVIDEELELVDVVFP